MDLNLAGRSGARCGMCRSPSASTSTILPRCRLLPPPLSLLPPDLLLSCASTPARPASPTSGQLSLSGRAAHHDPSQNRQAPHPSSSPRTRSIPLSCPLLQMRERDRRGREGQARGGRGSTCQTDEAGLLASRYGVGPYWAHDQAGRRLRTRL
jgi:hypothetical protein